MQRDTVPKGAWDVQLRGVNENWTKIATLFPVDRQLRVISQGPTYWSNERIFEAVFRNGLKDIGN